MLESVLTALAIGLIISAVLGAIGALAAYTFFDDD